MSRARPFIILAAALVYVLVTGWGRVGDWRELKDRERRLEQLDRWLSDAGASVAQVEDTLATLLSARAARDSASNRPYLVVSIAENRLWFKQGDSVIYATRVATGSGKYLERAGGERWKFETPRGRLVVERKDVEPQWVPPDWHYFEAAKKKGLRLTRLERGRPIAIGNGRQVAVSGSEVVMRYSDGREEPFEVKDGREIVVNGQLVMPPFGTNQRKYPGVLGANRLYLGDGYGIHGTDAPSSIGRSVSHGCVRVKNEDIETLFRIVPLGTPVYIY